MNIVVFVSGRGSNLEAILNSELLKGKIKIKAVFSDKLQCAAFEIAKRNSIPTYTVGDKEGCISYSNLAGILISYNTELVVLAGFLKLIPGSIVSEYKNKIINIHPALLPSFGGKGLYGINVHRAVFESSAKVSGATVHFVDETYDTGRIIAQQCVDISDVTSPGEIAERVLQVEHKLLPYVISKFADGNINVVNNRLVVN
ncbi:MAG: phosphoribosylglycinamide formyltransferase [Ignavibacteria bacterium GWA2_35_9]|nr:MAG: phosphoribosylglycinamide formyltransferase [Ignavibacteria bacterium GWA2_35_9]OGU48814.1 MAG: phosphoribosylglycinamide formyltransferase [Ignavibacteria bacterium GWB2_36_8]OGU48962.1 MAG: phosphoribosylglycinamide formyltransferase [Ignavibacteria bacterium GWC2_36_12]